MMHILIAGATGLVGNHALSLALLDPRIERVIAPTRRPLPVHPKLFNPVSDMSNLPDDPAWWKVSGVICALGTTRADAGSAQAFRAIDFDLALDIARHAHAHGAQRFALTSSMGADPASRLVYLRTKGELEQALAHIGWYSLTIVRPGAILGERARPRLGEKITAFFLSVFGPILPKHWRGNPAEAIAATLLEAAVTGASGRRVVNSGEIGQAAPPTRPMNRGIS